MVKLVTLIQCKLMLSSAYQLRFTTRMFPIVTVKEYVFTLTRLLTRSLILSFFCSYIFFLPWLPIEFGDVSCALATSLGCCFPSHLVF